jgi:hypothetical protein
MHTTPPDAPSVCASNLYCHLLIPPLFGWLLCVFSSIGGLIKPMCYLFLFNFVIQIVTRIDGMMPPPRTPNQLPNLLNIPSSTNTDSRLVVVSSF